MATTTANKKYTFSTIYQGKPLADWIVITHREMSRLSGWKYMPLNPGTFGYDNQAHSAALALTNYKEGMTRDEMASIVHDGWITNYTYWRDNKPWKTDPSKLYKQPAKPLGDKNRNTCAETPYDKLPQDEKDKDLMIADILLKNLKV